MNTWIVGNHPVGHYNRRYREIIEDQEKGVKLLGQKTFFMKARIMAGQANLKGNELGFKDFKWLAKDELQKELNPHYWSSVKNMLAER
jgi:large subunit ribosomal protein L46